MPPNDAFGPFELLAKLAKGGMAITHLARVAGAPPGHELVVKRILPEVANDRELRGLFAEEARLAQRLDHPNVIHTLGAGDVDGELYLALEYVWGEDLRAIARAARDTGSPLPRTLAARIAADAARGLHYAHTLAAESGEPLDLVHRDVSPPNIMVRFDGRVVVVDFGIAVVERRFQRVRAGQLKGKFAYMSPEQVQGLPVDKRSDVFALGIVLYEFTVGRRLFRGTSDVATAGAIANADIQAPREFDPDFPPELEGIILRALARNPAERFQTAEDLADALDEWIAGQSGGDQQNLAEWMQATCAARLQEIESWVGTSPYVGPQALPEVPWEAAVQTTNADSAQMSEPREPGDAGHTDDDSDVLDALVSKSDAAVEHHPTPNEVVSAMHELPSDQDNDPFFKASRASRPVFAFVALVVVGLVAIIGYKLMTEGVGTSHLAYYEPPPSRGDFVADPYVPPEPPPTLATSVTSEPPGAAIVANGVATRLRTPAEVELVASAVNVVSLHLRGYDTEFVETQGGNAVAATLRALPTPEAAPANGAEPAAEDAPSAEGSAEPVDPGPGPGRARIFVQATGTDGRPIDAEILVNGEPVGTAPVTVDVDARVRHHVSARMAGKRPSAAYARPIEWVDWRSVHEVNLELTSDTGDANRWTTLRLRTAPQTATVTIDGEAAGSTGMANLTSLGHHVIRVSAPDFAPMVRTVDGRLGQVALDTVLEPIRRDPAAVSVALDTPGTTVYAELLREGSPGARELRQPIESMELESGNYRFTLENRNEGARIRARFEFEVEPGTHHAIAYQIVDGEIVEASHEIVALGENAP